MSGKEILVDTNIVINLLRGSNELQNYLQGKDIYVSFITELELLGHKSISQREEQEINEILNDCSIVHMNNLIKEKYLLIKRAYTIKLPDAIIAASAVAFDMPLITADLGFQKISQLKVISHRPTAILADPKKDDKE